MMLAGEDFLHPDEEHPSQEYWEVDDPPDPTVAQTDGEFVAELRVLVQWSGLEPREIERRMMAYGGYVPEGTVDDLLHGNTLPSEELLVPLLWALGRDDETVELWIWARGRVAAADVQTGPAETSWVHDEPKKFSDGALAEAVKKRRDQSGWRGLHRRAFPDGDEVKHTPKRSRSKRSQPKKAGKAGSGSWSTRAMIGLVIAGVLAFGAGIVAAFSGGSNGATPPAPIGAGQTCCTESEAPASSQTPDVLPTSTLVSATPTLKTSTKATNSPTPRPSMTTQSPQSSPAQAPELAGSGSASCAPQGERWMVTVSVTGTLTGAPSGTNPQGRAGGGDPFPLSGSGGTSYSGQTTVDVGPAAEPAPGSISWSVSVTVAGGNPNPASGSAPYTCTSA